MEFKCLQNLFLITNSTQMALVNHGRSIFLRNWLSSAANVVSCTVNGYIYLLEHFLWEQNEPSLAMPYAHFIYHSYFNNFITETMAFYPGQCIPIVDGKGDVHVATNGTLIPASGSNWAKLMCYNPYTKEGYIDLGMAYAESRTFAGENMPEKVLLNFMIKRTKAVDLPELFPPNATIKVVSSELTANQAFLLLEWIRNLRAKRSVLPAKFITSIRDGIWMKTYSGFKSPNQCFLSNDQEESIFFEMGGVLSGVSVIDEGFYENKIRLYSDELELIGVQHTSKDEWKLINDYVTSLDSSRITNEQVLLLLKFVRYLKKRNKLGNVLLRKLKEGKWLKTSEGFKSPVGSVFLELGKEIVSQITCLPVVDEMFSEYTAELKLLGVVMDIEHIYKLIADNFKFPSDLSMVTGECVLMILNCIRNLGPSSAKLIEKIKNLPWLKTSLGFRRPVDTLLFSEEYDILLNVVQVPVIDEAFYGSKIQLFMAELKAIGVAVDFGGSLKRVCVQFKLLVSSCSLTCANVLSLLKCIKCIKGRTPSQLPELKSCLSKEKWLKTRHGYKCAIDSILFNYKWGTISQFVDLPLIDDAFYGIGIYAYREELKMMGVLVDFMEGSHLVAKGLNLPNEPGHVAAESALSLFECIGYLLQKSSGQPLPEDFLKKVREPKWLKTHMGFKSPDECLLFDLNWVSILKPRDGPFIDQMFYRGGISVHQNALKAIGVKVDAEDVCTVISERMVLLNRTPNIRRVYQFLKLLQWKPKSYDKSPSLIWIPKQFHIGEWVSSRACVLHDPDNLFSSRLHVLDRCYGAETLSFFSSAFNVAITPSIHDYIQLWSDWESDNQHQVTCVECRSFWACIIKNWNSSAEEMIREKIKKLPAMAGAGNSVQLVPKKELFIPDDLRLKKMLLESSDSPLFVWYPEYNFPSIPLRELFKIYSSIGARKVSQFVKFGSGSFSAHHKFEKVDPRNGLISKGLTKIILGFLASPQISMPVKERHEKVKALVDVVVFVTKEPLVVNCSLLLSSGEVRSDIKTNRMVVWERDSGRLLVHKHGWDNLNTSIEFITCFAQTLADGLLHEYTGMINDLCKMIMTGFVFGFEDNAVDYLMMMDNLQLFVDDELFLSATFPSSEKCCSPIRNPFESKPSPLLEFSVYKRRKFSGPSQ